MENATCSLDPRAKEIRLRVSNELGTRALIESQETSSGYRLRFRPEFEEDLKALIMAESKCCPFIDFALSREGDVLLVHADAPEEGRPAIAALFGLQEMR